MDDNARPHRAVLVDEFLQSEDIRRMDWPAMSPDLNPIKHVWHALGRAIGTRYSPPSTIQEMKTTLQNVWDQLPKELINCLISSMPSLCGACLAPELMVTLFQPNPGREVRMKDANEQAFKYRNLE
ncbi:DDE_3 domain-containing protein [Trichonephila clavipes]|nr:DDE_3 domain-containing protein [Trichonephila clavipes]